MWVKLWHTSLMGPFPKNVQLHLYESIYRRPRRDGPRSNAATKLSLWPWSFLGEGRTSFVLLRRRPSPQTKKANFEAAINSSAAFHDCIMMDSNEGVMTIVRGGCRGLLKRRRKPEPEWLWYMVLLKRVEYIFGLGQKIGVEIGSMWVVRDLYESRYFWTD